MLNTPAHPVGVERGRAGYLGMLEADAGVPVSEIAELYGVSPKVHTRL